MKIKISHLEEGLNELDFEHNSDSLNLSKLKEFGYSFKNPIEIHVQLNKVGTQYFLKVFTSTTANFTCDRCLEKFDKNLKDEFRLVYSTENEYFGDETEIRSIESENGEIDITNDIRESLLLTIPMKMICFENCLGLCPECGKNLNTEICDHKKQTIDSRWDALKKISNSIN